MSRSCNYAPRKPSLWLLIVALLLASSSAAHAHQASIARATIDVDADRTGAHLTLDLDATDSRDATDSPDTPSGEFDRADQDRAAQLLARVQSGVTVTSDGERCEAGAGSVSYGAAGAASVAWQIRCSQPIASLGLDYQLFFDQDPRHRALVHLTYDDTSALAEITQAQRALSWDLGQPPMSSNTAFIWSGVDHILFGFDHIAFVLALMMVVVLWRPYGPTGSIQRRRLGASLRDTASIVTTVTVAHSLTLISASLGWIALNGQLGESVIARSIIYVAIENVVRPTARNRHLITFVFGLVHGLGFASMLAALLPPGDVVVPLLCFNIGVELGQLAIVAVVLPVLALAARSLGARPYRATLVPLSSLALAILGALWLYERISGSEILGF